MFMEKVYVIFGKNITDTILCSFHCILSSYTISLCSFTGDANCNHFVEVVLVKFIHCRAVLFVFIIVYFVGRYL